MKQFCEQVATERHKKRDTRMALVQERQCEQGGRIVKRDGKPSRPVRKVPREDHEGCQRPDVVERNKMFSRGGSHVRPGLRV